MKNLEKNLKALEIEELEQVNGGLNFDKDLALNLDLAGRLDLDLDLNLALKPYLH